MEGKEAAPDLVGGNNPKRRQKETQPTERELTDGFPIEGETAVGNARKTFDIHDHDHDSHNHPSNPKHFPDTELVVGNGRHQTDSTPTKSFPRAGPAIGTPQLVLVPQFGFAGLWLFVSLDRVSKQYRAVRKTHNQ